MDLFGQYLKKNKMDFPIPNNNYGQTFGLIEATYCFLTWSSELVKRFETNKYDSMIFLCVYSKLLSCYKPMIHICPGTLTAFLSCLLSSFLGTSTKGQKSQWTNNFLFKADNSTF